MDFSNKERQPAKRIAGIGIAIVLQSTLVYALLNGLHVAGVHFSEPPGVTVLPEPPKVLQTEPPKQWDFKPKDLPRDFVHPVEMPVVLNSDYMAIKEVTVQPSPIGDPVIPRHDGYGTGTTRVAAVVDPRSCERPEYPAHELDDGVEGTTVLQFLIGADGRVMDSKVVTSSGSVALDKAALRGLGRCAFRAGTVDGKPEPSWAKIQYVWKLD